MRKRKHRSEGFFAATYNKSVLIVPAKGLRTVLRAGFSVQPLRAYLAEQYRITDNPLLRALIAVNYPECTTMDETQDALPLE